jgi:two-component sensor histidine kinase
VCQFADSQTRKALGRTASGLFAQAFEASSAPMVLLAADPPRFTIVRSNKAHAAALRRAPEALHGRSILDVIPVRDDGAHALLEAVRASLQRALDTGRPAEMPPQPRNWADVLGKAEARYWRATHTPLFAPNGKITHILATVRDVTDEIVEERVNEARALLMREIDHRARNAFAMVQSIIQMTDAPDQGTFKREVQRRVAALGRAQSTLARRKWQGASLHEVAESELSALAPPGAYALAGPNLLLPAAQVQAISMILHELATNARKYGALSACGGAISVSWTIEDQRLRLTWAESGGPCAAQPENAGFGSRLIARLVRQLGGELSCDWRPEGLRMQFTAPL